MAPFSTIGNYRILEEIASGSFGRVYRGQHLHLTSRIIAIKVLHQMHLSSQREHNSFLHEAQLLETLEHPHILRFYDVGFHEGLPYLVTEFAPNGSLRQRLRQRRPRLLPLEESLTILQQIAQALDFAHEHSIIHRDLKPENILFHANGNALLADFGISAVLATASFLQATLSGTPAYMAPEQFKGKISKESDQYALGCLAFELLTGHKPFTAPDAFSLAFQHIQKDPPTPSSLCSTLPESIDAVMLKVLAKDRKARYSSAGAFVSALQDSLQHPSPALLSSTPNIRPHKETGTHTPSSEKEVPLAVDHPSQGVALEPQRDRAFLTLPSIPRSKSRDALGAISIQQPHQPVLHTSITRQVADEASFRISEDRAHSTDTPSAAHSHPLSSPSQKPLFPLVRGTPKWSDILWIVLYAIVSYILILILLHYMEVIGPTINVYPAISAYQVLPLVSGFFLLYFTSGCLLGSWRSLLALLAGTESGLLYVSMSVSSYEPSFGIYPFLYLSVLSVIGAFIGLSYELRKQQRKRYSFLIFFLGILFFFISLNSIGIRSINGEYSFELLRAIYISPLLAIVPFLGELTIRGIVRFIHQLEKGKENV